MPVNWEKPQKGQRNPFQGGGEGKKGENGEEEEAGPRQNQPVGRPTTSRSLRQEMEHDIITTPFARFDKKWRLCTSSPLPVTLCQGLMPGAALCPVSVQQLGDGALPWGCGRLDCWQFYPRGIMAMDGRHSAVLCT